MTFGPPPLRRAPSTPTSRAVNAPRGRPPGRGGKARKAGDTAEAHVAAAANRDERVWLVKRPVPFRPVGGGEKGGAFLAVRTAAAGVDFSGVLRGGLALAIEVKSAARASLPLRNQAGDQVGPSQAAELSRVAALGGVAGLLVRLELGDHAQRRGLPPRAWWWVTWEAWTCAAAEARAEGSASVDWRALERWGWRCEANPDGTPRFVDAVLKSEEEACPAKR